MRSRQLKAATTRLNYVWGNGVEVLAARWYLRHVDVVGERVRIDGRPSVSNGGRMVIGPRVRVVSRIAKTQLISLPGATLEVGERTLLNYGGSICAAEHIRIGARCLIGTHAIIMDNDFHRIEPERRLERPESRPIAIGDNVWIGARVIVLGGVTIGADSCIAAGSVVIDDIPPRCLAGGVPARVLRKL
jgi:maltose O-acetyltransferase